MTSEFKEYMRYRAKQDAFIEASRPIYEHFVSSTSCTLEEAEAFIKAYEEMHPSINHYDG